MPQKSSNLNSEAVNRIYIPSTSPGSICTRIQCAFMVFMPRAVRSKGRYMVNMIDFGFILIDLIHNNCGFMFNKGDLTRTRLLCLYMYCYHLVFVYTNRKMDKLTQVAEPCLLAYLGAKLHTAQWASSLVCCVFCALDKR